MKERQTDRRIDRRIDGQTDRPERQIRHLRKTEERSERAGVS